VGPARRFDKKTLFDRINGAAPVYLAAGFVASWGAEYTREGRAHPVIVDLYDMGGTARALGIYATERDPAARQLDLGAASHVTSGILNLRQGAYYLKLAGGAATDEENAALAALAAELVKGLETDPTARAKLAAILSLLPEQGRLPQSEAYAHAPLAGIAGLQQAHLARYGNPQTPHRLFLILAEDNRAASTRYERARNHLRHRDEGRLDESESREVRTLLVGHGDRATLIMVSKQALVGGLDLPASSVSEVQRLWIEALQRIVGAKK